MSSTSCILLICTFPSLFWSVSTSAFHYSRECHVNIHVNCLVPPGIVATEQSSGPFSLLFLSMDVARGQTVRSSNILSFPSFQTHSGCSGFLLTSQGLTFAFNRLEPGLNVPQKSAQGGRCPLHSFYSSFRECNFTHSLTKAG